MQEPFLCLAVRTRLELATPCVTGMYSNQTELPDQSLFSTCAFFLESGCKSTNIFQTGKIFFRFFFQFYYNRLFISADSFKKFSVADRICSTKRPSWTHFSSFLGSNFSSFVKGWYLTSTPYQVRLKSVSTPYQLLPQSEIIRWKYVEESL